MNYNVASTLPGSAKITGITYRLITLTMFYTPECKIEVLAGDTVVATDTVDTIATLSTDVKSKAQTVNLNFTQDVLVSSLTNGNLTIRVTNMNKNRATHFFAAEISGINYQGIE